MNPPTLTEQGLRVVRAIASAGREQRMAHAKALVLELIPHLGLDGTGAAIEAISKRLDELEKCRMTRKRRHDAVNHPAHYTRGGIEVLDALEAWGLDLLRGSAVQYLVRAGHKDPATELEDLRKARFYVDRAIAQLERAQGRKRGGR